MRHFTRARTAAVALGLALALAGCSDNDKSSNDDGQAAGPTGKEFNQADVEFAQQMIPHHRQAVEMAELAEQRAGSAEVEELAAAIAAAQGPEIETMSGWLSAWGEEVPEETSGMDHGDSAMEEMPGMMSDEDIAQLEAANGAPFDQAFLTKMIEHHEGAVEMAETEQAEGKNTDAITLAGKIRADQTAEIQTMQDLLQQS